ncbi:MAG: efflux RND transporter permease subunit [Phycisphaerales bacterium]|nr:efflux RND transporter permease subunit [Phycisphaerales bacterium]
MSLSTPFIHRPIGTSLLTIAIALAGILAYFVLPVAPLPQIDFPTIYVSAALPGASPETMASSVVTPLERQIGHIAGITEMTSSSSLGSCFIAIQFDLSRDVNAAARDIQAAINAAASQLPANLPSNPTYRKYNPSDSPIIMLYITSEVYSRPEIYDAVSTVLVQKISQIDGVGTVSVWGSALPAVRIEVNPVHLNAMGLSLEDVRNFLASVNVNRPKGHIEGNRYVWEVAATDQLLKASQYRPLILTYINGAAVHLSDVADVYDGAEDSRGAGIANGEPAVICAVFRQTGANILDTVDRVKAAIPQLQASIAPAIHIHIMMDRTNTIRASVNDVQRALIIAVCLVVLVVFIFLRDPRSTLIPSVAVPISLLGTFGVMYLCGYSINNLSLMALAVATGFVVDDAIVVIENITRHLESGMTPFQAALHGAKEIGFTVMSMSISLMAVFIPIFYMGGSIGRFFREFAVVLAVAVGISMIVSLTTTPMMCAYLLSPHTNRRHNFFYRASQAVDRLLLGIYRRSLGWVLHHSLLMLIVTLATITATIFFYIYIPKDLLPPQDVGRLGVSIVADQDSSTQNTVQLLYQVAAIVAKDPAVDACGGYQAGGRNASNSAGMFVSLKDMNIRKKSAQEIVSRLGAALSHIPGAQITPRAFEDIRSGARSSGANIQYTLQGQDLDELGLWSQKVFDKVKTIKGLGQVNSDLQLHGREARLTIDRDTASRLGISATTLDNILYDAFGQRQVSTMYASLNQYHVVMEVDPAFAQDPTALQYVYAKSVDGTPIPLSAFTHYEQSASAISINHQSQFPCVTISFNLNQGFSLSQAVDEIQQVVHDLGLPASIHGSFTGTAGAYQQSLASNIILIAAAILAVYIVLGILYESLIHPITILSTIPSAGVGALLALMVCQTSFTIIALIGIILLIGIVKKNAIMMIDFALAAQRGEQIPPRDAIFHACLLRFRPILMTTMAAMLGGLPLALGSGIGAEFRRPLGIAIVGGLMLSQLLTLYTTPVIYLYLDRLRLWATGRNRVTG